MATDAPLVDVPALFSGIPAAATHLQKITACWSIHDHDFQQAKDVVRFLAAAGYTIASSRANTVWQKAQRSGVLHLSHPAELLLFLNNSLTGNVLARTGYGEDNWQLPTVPVKADAGWASTAVLVMDCAAVMWKNPLRTDAEYTLTSVCKHTDRIVPDWLSLLEEVADEQMLNKPGDEYSDEELLHWACTGLGPDEVDEPPPCGTVVAAVRMLLQQPMNDVPQRNIVSITLSAGDKVVQPLNAQQQQPVTKLFEGETKQADPVSDQSDTNSEQSDDPYEWLEGMGLLCSLRNEWDRQALVTAALLDPHRYPVKANNTRVFLLTPAHLASTTLEEVYDVTLDDLSEDQQLLHHSVMRWASLLVANSNQEQGEVLALAQKLDETIASLAAHGSPHQQVAEAVNSLLRKELPSLSKRAASDCELLGRLSGEPPSPEPSHDSGSSDDEGSQDALTGQTATGSSSEDKLQQLHSLSAVVDPRVLDEALRMLSDAAQQQQKRCKVDA